MLILASQSPRRSELLRNAGFSFKIVPSDAEEIAPENFSPAEKAVFIASLKACNIAPRYMGEIIIGADTIVVLENIIMGKPKDADDAFRMISMLSGKTHTVITGVCVLYGDVVHKNNKICFFERTEVEFYPLTENEIYNYIGTGEPFDKAGAYGIQEKGALLVKRINGDYFNVVGLPIGRLSRVLRSLTPKGIEFL